MKFAVFSMSMCAALALFACGAVAQDWVTPFQDSGNWTPTPIPEDGDQALGQTFEVTQGLQGIGFQSPTWNGTGAGYRLRVFAWDTDYATSVAGDVLGETTVSDHPDNAWVDLVLDEVLPPGQYLAVTDQPVRGSGNVGHWGWNESDAAGGAVPGGYSNGALIADFEFQIRYAEAEYTGGEGEGEGEGEAIVMTFDCGRSGWIPNGSSTLTDNIGSVTFMPTAGDPFMITDVPVDGATYQELAFQVNVAGAPNDSFPAAFFWFADGGHGRAGFNLTGDGDYTVRMNVPGAKDSGAASWDSSVFRLRLDFPDGDATAFIDAGTMFTLDWLTITDDAEYVPAASDLDGIDCDGDGLGNGYEAILGTDPLVADTDGDGVDDGVEISNGTDPLDSGSTPTVPVAGGFALVAAALVLALAGLALVRRRSIA